jgi:hypothetical protein
VRRSATAKLKTNNNVEEHGGGGLMAVITVDP